MGWGYDSSSCRILETRCVKSCNRRCDYNWGTLTRSRDNHKAFNLRFSLLFCFAPRNSWNENATLLLKFCFVFFLLITISQAVECQRIILGFSEFSVARRCANQETLCFWQLEKKAESPVRGRGPENQEIDWDQRGGRHYYPQLMR